MMPRIIWTDDMIEALIKARAEGLPYTECARIIGVAHSTARDKAHALGLPMKLNHGKKGGSRILIEQARGPIPEGIVYQPIAPKLKHLAVGEAAIFEAPNSETVSHLHTRISDHGRRYDKGFRGRSCWRTGTLRAERVR